MKQIAPVLVVAVVVIIVAGFVLGTGAIFLNDKLTTTTTTTTVPEPVQVRVGDATCVRQSGLIVDCDWPSGDDTYGDEYEARVEAGRRAAP